jgi:hypothetical protein
MKTNKIYACAGAGAEKAKNVTKTMVLSVFSLMKIRASNVMQTVHPKHDTSQSQERTHPNIIRKPRHGIGIRVLYESLDKEQDFKYNSEQQRKQQHDERQRHQ